MKLASRVVVLLGGVFAIAALIPIVEEARTPSFDSSVVPYFLPQAIIALALFFVGAYLWHWEQGKKP